MPTQTFYNLSSEKREKIEEAIREEIVSKGIADASINQIVRKADISRGSFYQYFADKEDMIEYMLREFERRIRQVFHQYMLSCRGNIFRCFEGILEEVIIFAEGSGEFMNFHRSLLADPQISNWFCSKKGKQRVFERIYAEIAPFLQETYYGKSKAELFLILEMLLETICHTVMDAFWQSGGVEDWEQIKRKFHDKISILEKGFEN